MEFTCMSSNDACYFLLIVDDHTHFMWIYILHTKDQAHFVFVSYMETIERNFSVKLGAVQTNDGGDFKILDTHPRTLGFIHSHFMWI